MLDAPRGGEDGPAAGVVQRVQLEEVHGIGGGVEGGGGGETVCGAGEDAEQGGAVGVVEVWREGGAGDGACAAVDDDAGADGARGAWAGHG